MVPHWHTKAQGAKECAAQQQAKEGAPGLAWRLHALARLAVDAAGEGATCPHDSPLSPNPRPRQGCEPLADALRLSVVATAFAAAPPVAAVPEPVVAAPGARAASGLRRPAVLVVLAPLRGVLVVAPALAPVPTITVVPEPVVALTRLAPTPALALALALATVLATVLAPVRALVPLGIVAPALAPVATVAVEVEPVVAVTRTVLVSLVVPTSASAALGPIIPRVQTVAPSIAPVPALAVEAEPVVAVPRPALLPTALSSTSASASAALTSSSAVSRVRATLAPAAAVAAEAVSRRAPSGGSVRRHRSRK